MYKHWQLWQSECAGNHISAAGQGHWVGLTDSLINQGHHRLPRYMSQSALSSLASTVSPSLRPGQHQNMQNISQRRSRFSFWHWQPILPHASRRTYSSPNFVTHEHHPVELITRLIDTCSWAIFAEHWAGLVDSPIKFEALHFWPPSQCC